MVVRISSIVLGKQNSSNGHLALGGLDGTSLVRVESGEIRFPLILELYNLINNN